jgi:hypothetical protein
MSIATEAIAEFNPAEFYGPENQPPRDEQQTFLRHALLEAAEIDDPASFKKGPYGQQFTDILRKIQDGLRQVNPTFTAETLMPFGYQSEQARRRAADFEPEERTALVNLNLQRHHQIANLAKHHIGPALVSQILPRGVLDEPAYHYQGENWGDFESARACANACFRMVFEGITGFSLREDTVAASMHRQHGSHVVADAEYRKLFATDVFYEASDKHVRSIEIMGADIKTIGMIAMRLKERNNDAKIFSIVALSSENGGRDVEHRCVLLGTNAKGVICHDPAAKDKLPARILSHEDFTRRWAITQNRTQIFFST